MGFLKDKFCELVDSFFSEQVGKVEGLIQNKLDKKVIIKQFDEISQRFFDEKIENSLRIEEIDFPALNEFVKGNLLVQIKEMLSEIDGNEKQKDIERFLSSCINISKAKTENGKRIVKLYVETAIDIIRRFFVGENPDSLRVLLSETSENTKGYIDESTKEIKEAVKNSTDKNSFEYLIDSINPKTQSTSPFHFRNDIITFQGREYEQKEIYNFLEDERKLLWMAITGDGGSGKSKLMYHMTQRLERGSDWKVIWLEDESLKSILEKTEFKYSKNLLFICDYGGQFSEKLRTLINRIDTFGNKGSGKKIRLIILEREGFAENCGEILEPMWYRNFCGNSSQNGRVNNTVYDKNKLMNLNPLNDEDFKSMVKDYLAEKKKSLSDEEINTVIEKAHKIDHRKTGVRPLILLFVADAVANGKEAKNWDLNKLVEHVIKRYEDHWKNIICKGDEELFKAVKEITAYATAVGGWNLRNKKIGEPIKSSIDLFLRKVNDKNMFLCSVCEKTETDGIWSPLEPDLLGEFFVLEFFREKIQNYDDEYVTNFSDICWENDSVLFTWFLSRCAQNYCRQERFKTIFANGMEIFEPKYEENEGRAVKNLEWMSKNFKKQVARTVYAVVLYNLSCVQELKEREKTIEKLEELWKSAPENQEVRTEYAKGLANLSCVQELKESENTIKKLKELWRSTPDNQEVLTAYAKGLAYFSIRQNLSETEATIEKLKSLEREYPKNFNIQTAYTIGIIVKVLKKVQLYKTKEPIESDIAEIKKYVEEHKDNEELQKLFNEFIDDLAQILP